jgi:hypothetical protein
MVGYLNILYRNHGPRRNCPLGQGAGHAKYSEPDAAEKRDPGNGRKGQVATPKRARAAARIDDQN